MGYKLSFMLDNFFSLKKYRRNYVFLNKNFLMLFIVFGALTFQNIIEKELEEIKSKIRNENKKLRTLRKKLE